MIRRSAGDAERARPRVGVEEARGLLHYRSAALSGYQAVFRAAGIGGFLRSSCSMPRLDRRRAVGRVGPSILQGSHREPRQALPPVSLPASQICTTPSSVVTRTRWISWAGCIWDNYDQGNWFLPRFTSAFRDRRLPSRLPEMPESRSVFTAKSNERLTLRVASKEWSLEPLMSALDALALLFDFLRILVVDFHQVWMSARLQ